ncbi:hypothetical protein BCR37DRAFT_382902 [Protomyces lactucae-debilis]|uniref:RGS domain-containing protein n=1 Tax=Protomyces lactucae-debilis TaxID=2754530 RepID=A0A1Y2F0H7_PROLT|nr:uncharacterized protein BCR37DRAFT_382902 [Protomyces lactucae-debilis]ORY77388.1 hypothetical protein BCR37DRAFT_382902 [Protomyces lactucae-debilis]
MTEAKSKSEQKQLSLAAILGDQTCPPCSLKEFQDYLVYKERSAENLQFFNWISSYERRFARLESAEATKIPKPPPRKTYGTPSLRGRSDSRSSSRSNVSTLATLGEGTEDSEKAGAVPVFTSDTAPTTIVPPATAGPLAPPILSTGAAMPDSPFDESAPVHEKPTKIAPPSGPLSTLVEQDMTELTAEQIEQFPPSEQPFRAEIDRVVEAFFLPGGPAELNVTGPIQKYIREQAQKTTHPEIFEEAKQHVYTTMQKSSFPAFSKMATANINHEKKVFWLCVGTTDFMLGVMVYLLCILLKAGRGWRCFGIPFTWFGCMQFYSALLDLCFQVYGRTARQLYPWELMQDDKSFNLATADADFGDNMGGINFRTIKQGLLPKSKVFEKEKVIEDPIVKAIQRRRWIQTYIVATTVAACVIAIFLAVPNRP